jgi:4-diphosphocytidyl-2-C-methyl-D-erythritol kinase
MKKLSVLAPAKINLYLDVFARRADGYHDIESVMQTVSLFDRLTVIRNHTQDGKKISLSCRASGIPTDEKNLVWRAALRFFEMTQIEAYDVAFILEKKIPSEAGLGGGSSDAAAALLALNRLYETALSLDELCALGAKLGADIPFCIKKGTVYTTGIGDVMTSAPPMPDCAFLIAKPKGKGISTAEAYRAIDALPAENGENSFGRFKEALNACDLSLMSELLYNKFELVTPEHVGSAALKEQFLQTGAYGALMSGSGSAVFAIYPDIASARKAKDALSEDMDIFLCTPVRRDYPYFEG